MFGFFWEQPAKKSNAIMIMRIPLFMIESMWGVYLKVFVVFSHYWQLIFWRRFIKEKVFELLI